MHFKLDLKEKKTLMKKGKSVANGTFFSKIIPLPCPFSCFWRMGHFYLQHLWIDGGDGWKSASERPIWSAFNGLEWKAGEGDRTFSSSFCRECYFWNFLSGIIHRAFFFFFDFLCLLYMNCFCGTQRLPWPPLFSLSAGTVWYLPEKMDNPSRQI